MNNLLKLKRKDGVMVDTQLIELKLSDIDKIMELQEAIINGLENKEIYAETEKDEFEEYLNGKGKVIGYVTSDHELIAMGVYVSKGYDESNYAYDLDLCGEDILKVGQIEATIVKDEYRGNKLQKLMCEELEKIAKENNNELLCATASPYNKFSVNTFINLGYEIKKDKLKYCGLRRYVLVKNLYVNNK